MEDTSFTLLHFASLISFLGKRCRDNTPLEALLSYMHRDGFEAKMGNGYILSTMLAFHSDSRFQCSGSK